MPSTHDIVIIGAGLAGSSVAAALAAQGWDVLLVERDHFPRHKVCGEFLSPDSQSSLAALGLAQTAAALGPVALPGARFVSPHGLALPIPLPGPAWGLSRYALDAALAEAAMRAGATLMTGATALALRSDEHGYALDLRHEGQLTTLRARAAILACGRQALPGLRAAPRPRSDSKLNPHQASVGVKCHYENLRMPPEVEIYLFRGGYAGLNPVEGGRANLGMLVTRDAFQRAGASIAGLLEAVGRWNPALGRRLAGATALPESACAVAAVDTGRPSAPWGLTAQLGDAATMIPPLCGDGMAMALRAAEICAPLAHATLATSISRAQWRERYEAAWHAEFNSRLRIGRQLQLALSTPLLADAAMAAGWLLPGLAAQLARATRGQLH